jgi:2-polyprenyl-3-methyl-5-hydroxy-6-metoxy-1,4-benzoquinol methylase
MATDVSRAAFDAVYDRSIVARSFNENVHYYEQSRERYWRSLQFFRRTGFGPGTRTLDIGGGQFGILLASLLGHRAAAGDVVDTAEQDVRAAGLDFHQIDLFSDANMVEEPFDCVTILEVIEHIPQPPYVVLRRIARLLRPGGMIFLTTPNFHRFRNVAYMLAGREILDIYRYPGPNEALGHQHEYTRKQLLWQVQKAGLETMFCDYYSDGWRGATPAARMIRLLSRPVDLAPRLRNSIVLAARTPVADEAGPEGGRDIRKD